MAVNRKRESWRGWVRRSGEASSQNLWVQRDIERPRERMLPGSFVGLNSRRESRVKYWLPFVESYRTLCIAPSPEVKAVFEGLERLSVAG